MVSRMCSVVVSTGIVRVLVVTVTVASEVDATAMLNRAMSRAARMSRLRAMSVDVGVRF